MVVSTVAITAGLAHIFVDMLSAPDIADPVEPLWPLYDGSISFDVIYYDAPLWNVGLLLHAGLWWRSRRD